MRSVAMLAIAGGLAGSAGAARAAEEPSRPLVASATPGDAGTQRILDRVAEAWFAAEWRDYRDRFLHPDGRIVDNANGNASHSEGQGYGMLLAEAAGDAASFDAIWTWTHQHLYVRSDGLASWKWDPDKAALADRNNATDGDVLIAWALSRAAERFGRPDYRVAAQGIAAAIGQSAIAQTRAGAVLMPGVLGFGANAQVDGPVINLSYYVFPAFGALKSLAPSYDWDGLRANGMSLLERSAFGPLRLPTDWIGLGDGAPRPAAKYPASFGYDAIRIPLYLAWAGAADVERDRHFSSLWNPHDDLGPFVTDARTGAAKQAFGGNGYRMVAALATCVVRGKPIPEDLASRRDELYYPATLRLLTVVAARERSSKCL